MPDPTPTDDRDDRRADDRPDGPAVPERRLMAAGLPDWDLEPPTVFIRRGDR